MTQQAPEFSRPVALGRLGDRPMTLDPEADETERAALRDRFGLLSLDDLRGEVELTRDGDVVTMSGRMLARLEQACVVTGKPVAQSLDEPVALRFVAEGQHGAGHGAADELEEVELSEEDCDTLFHDGRTVDVGEALAQTMALSLDPFPRAEGADMAARDAGVKSEGEAGAFGALADLKAKLEKRQ